MPNLLASIPGRRNLAGKPTVPKQQSTEFEPPAAPRRSSNARASQVWIWDDFCWQRQCFIQPPSNPTALSHSNPTSSKPSAGQVRHGSPVVVTRLTRNRGKTKSTLKKHRRKTQKVKCPVCGFELSREHDLQRHWVALHTTQPPRWPCNYCVTSFSREDKLKKHLRTHHPEFYNGSLGV